MLVFNTKFDQHAFDVIDRKVNSVHVSIIRKAPYYSGWPSPSPHKVPFAIAQRLIKDGCAVRVDPDESQIKQICKELS